MSKLIYFILGVIAGSAVIFFFRKKMRKDKKLTPLEGKPLMGLIDTQAKEKEENKRTILAFFKSHLQVVNNDIEALLKISDATATRYLEELEKEGQIRQVGKTGKYVYYEKVG